MIMPPDARAKVTSASLMPPTPECRILAATSSVERLFRLLTIAST
jgi:hypothetical protein